MPAGWLVVAWHVRHLPSYSAVLTARALVGIVAGHAAKGSAAPTTPTSSSSIEASTGSMSIFLTARSVGWRRTTRGGVRRTAHAVALAVGLPSMNRGSTHPTSSGDTDPFFTVFRGVFMLDLHQSSLSAHVETRRRAWNARALRAIAVLALIVTPPVMAADPPAGEGVSGAAFLEKAWPDHPEWLAMLADILVKGEQLTGRDGWYHKSVVPTRFDWKSTRKALDRDGDGSISRIEFSGPDADFARLDRIRDEALTAADFDFASPTAGAVPASLLFARARIPHGRG